MLMRLLEVEAIAIHGTMVCYTRFVDCKTVKHQKGRSSYHATDLKPA